ncbi:protein Wnt-16-like [Rhipicephalus microplus]|uniref:protein Wnt-16-like n=1 Tax=Rhipicephalus microplus TaxID=6941 RepID=UPI003F6B95BF
MGVHVWVAVLAVLLLHLPRPASSNWMYLGTLGGRSVDTVCESAPLQGRVQRQLCRQQPGTVAAVAVGARLALAHCQRLFRHEPWNCSQHSFGHTLRRGSPETAFLYALHSAGVAHTVARACATGQLKECACGSTAPAASHGAWRWGGCSDDVQAGLRVSRQLGRAAERSSRSSEPLRQAANLHNLRAGRIALASRVRLRCRCHGVSGSCGLRSCWRTLSPLASVGRLLRSRYRRSVRLRRPGDPRARPSDLVHVRPSPDFCRPEPGVPGSQGRPCAEPTSCGRICCGRGFETRTLRRLQRCRCRFHWCCYVTCDTCESKVRLYSCR